MPSSMIQKLNGLLRTDNLGKVVHYFDEVESTNATLFELAQKGASEGAVVIADSQTRGRGRLGRTWVSPGGYNLYLSVLFRPAVGAQESTLLTLVSSIALYECLKKTGVQAPAIKWPNDILIEKRKVAGVLTELKARGERTDFVVVGIGVNVNMSRGTINREMAEFAPQATSVSENLGREVDRAKFAADLLYELERWYGTLSGPRGKSVILTEWTERWGGANEKVRVSVEGRDEFYGIARGIDENGYLLVEREDGEMTPVISGDVTAM